MKDLLTAEHRSWNMSKIRSKNTKPEIAVRKALHAAGFRFRLHAKNLPGKPDIVLPKWKTVIFVHGCFWHQHKGCKNATIPSYNRLFWVQKFKTNIARDRIKKLELKKLGYKILTVWECKIHKGSYMKLLTRKIV